MNDPWAILGWMVVTVVGIILGTILLGILIGIWKLIRTAVSNRIKHYRTRNVQPAKGQRWMQNDHVIEITYIHDNGSIAIRSGNASWGDSPEDWKKRVRNRKLYLLNK